MADKNADSPAPSSSNTGSQKPTHPNTGGLRGVRTTSLFRAVNFELFVKPNKAVMAFGLVAITGCVAYIGYMHAMKENKTDELIYEQYRPDGSTEWTRTKRSKWD
ncbi:small integral membrane protein 8-like [Amphiura filiformis]|uniref:small integral membrane protein 8-like n=1 Tax=Amphiura filiformis TaxID=82378 RepID=UPI003B2245C3